MRHLVLTPDRNTDGNDFKGAFKPESERYAAFWRSLGDEVQVHRIDVSQHSGARIAAMETLLAAAAPIDRFVVLCHGWKNGMQFGLKSDAPNRARLDAFAARLVAASTPSLKVALYCCSTGASDSPDGDGGFADALRDALCLAGRPEVTVFAHTSAGHTTRSAAVRWFLGSPVGGRGGVDLIRRGTPQYRTLYARLHDVRDPLRFRLPYMTPEQVVAEVA